MTPDQTDDDLSIAQPDDFFHKRDADSELQPVTQPIPGVEEQLRVIPMTVGDINGYGDSGEQLNPESLTTEDLAAIINNHWYDVRVDDDFDVTAEMVEEDMIGFGRDALIQAILRASGYDMQNALNLENIEMLDKLDEGKLDTLMDLQDRV